MTDHSPVQAVAVQGARPPAVLFTAAVLRGAVAAGLGFGALAVPVTLMWISSPYPDSGPRGALHVAAGLWLLAHGTELVRVDTLSGAPAPVGVVPLLLVALPVWAAHRAVRDTLESGAGARGAAGLVLSGVTSGYLVIAMAVAMYSTGGALAAEPLSAALHLPAVTTLSAVAGAWTACGRPLGPLPAWVPEVLCTPRARIRCVVALRAAGAATATLAAGGALLLGASLVWNWQAAGESLVWLAADWPGRIAVVVLAVTLVPNAAVWGAAFALGPGFALGTDAAAGPLAVAGDARPLRFPLLAAVPPHGLEAPLMWACAAVPVAAGGVIGWCTSRAAHAACTVGGDGDNHGEADDHGDGDRHGEADDHGDADNPGDGREGSGGRRETARIALLAAALCAVLMALLAAWAGGPLGTGRLAVFGPAWWLTGAAAFVWTAAVGIPVAVGAHTWRMRRESRRGRPAASREVRWAAAKRARAALGLAGLVRLARLVRGAVGGNGRVGPVADAAPETEAGAGAEPGAPEQDDSVSESVGKDDGGTGVDADTGTDTAAPKSGGPGGEGDVTVGADTCPAPDQSGAPGPEADPGAQRDLP
ncbi:DUF6350 family protein [Streptomyces sp. NPDC127084]|uniref:cell division protein PerM n=1 Tax=Streptomyces sp. NPDC127084 TaxID=3347133 RepID=UPI003652E3AA